MGRPTRSSSSAITVVLTAALWLAPTALRAQPPGGPDDERPTEPQATPPGPSPYEPTTAAPEASQSPAGAPDAAPTSAQGAGPTAGEATLQSCVRAFGAAQKLRRAGKLVESRAQVTHCAQPRCPVVLSSRCVSWHRELADAIPTIVVAATDPNGRDTLAVSVNVDGRHLATSLDGRAIPLNPGMHVLRFEHPGSPVLRRLVVLTEGEKNRRVVLAFSKAPAGWHAPIAPPAETKRAEREREPLWPLVIGGFGLAAAGVAVGTIAGAVALGEHDALAESCPGGVCPDELRDDYRQATTLAHVSTLSFIAAGVGTGVGIASLLIGSGTDSPVGHASHTVALRASIGLGAASLTGSFH